MTKFKKQLPTKNILDRKYYNCLNNFKYSTHRGRFFDASSMKFFNSKISDSMYKDRFFISSEKYNNEPRKYTVRLICPSDSIETIGEFQQFKTKKQAHNFIEKYLTKEIADIINLIRFNVNSGKYKRNVISYIKKNPKAFNSIIDLELMSDYFNRYLNEFKTEIEGSK